MRKGSFHIPATKEKISETKKRQHIIPKSSFKEGYTPWNRGKRYPLGAKNFEAFNRSYKEEKHWNWKGGITKVDKSIRRMGEYLRWRSDVFQRDNWTCQTCRITGVYVTAHHKKSFSKIIKENNIKSRENARSCKELWDIENGVTLCEECHSLTDNYRYLGKEK